jgi:hypothetical protein
LLLIVQQSKKDGEWRAAEEFHDQEVSPSCGDIIAKKQLRGPNGNPEGLDKMHRI